MSQRRVYQNQYPYFITSCSFKRLPFFDDVIIAKLLSENILAITKKYSSTLFAYCIMPNHIHLLIKFVGKEDVSIFMHDVKSITATILFQNKSIGSYLWQKRFYETVANSKEKYIASLQYIEQNHKLFHLDPKYSNPPYLFINKTAHLPGGARVRMIN